MKIIPAIDLLDGSCVRLLKGNYNESTVYNSDPVKTAEVLYQSGCSRIHIVDLDAARNKGRNNRTVIEQIRTAVPDAVIETGGGIRSEKDVEELLSIGIDRLILGTVFAEDPSVAGRWTKTYGKVFIAGIDALNGEVKVSGWEKGSHISDIDLAKKAAENGIISIIYTNINRDGTMTGPDVERSIRIAEAGGLPVIISGGISSEEDFKSIADIKNKYIAGVITGKALYENKIDLEKLTALYDTGTPGELW